MWLRRAVACPSALAGLPVRIAHGQSRQHRILIAPGIEAVRANADGDIEIEPERQLPFLGFRTTAVELIVGQPLDELKEPDRFCLGLTDPSEAFVFCSSPRGRPFPPGVAEFPPQPFKTCKAGKRRSSPIAKASKGVLPFFRALPEKRFICELERPRLRVCDALVINAVLPTQPVDLFLQPGRLEAGKFRNRLHIDVEGVEKESAVRCVGTGIGCPVVE